MLDLIVVAVLGALVGAAEMTGRYRDEPGRALLSVPGWLYISLNLVVAVAALLLTRSFGWTFGASGDNAVRWTQVLVSGIGAMIVMRASLFTVKVGSEDVAVGPSSFIETIFSAVDREVDRLRAQERATAISKIMQDVSFSKSYVALPAYCFALMQNLPDEDQKQFGKLVQAISTIPDADADDHVKALLLGAQLMNLVGDEVLQAAVMGLSTEIVADGHGGDPAPVGGAPVIPQPPA